MNSKAILWALAAIFLWTSCEKDDEPEITTPDPEVPVMALCEGAFLGNNSSISLIDPEDNSVQNGAFEAINGYGPGDVLHSAEAHEGKIYLVINNSGRIEVMVQDSLIAEAPINGLISPREILPVSATKAYVSNLFTNSVQIVDLDSKSVTGAIDVSGWSEGMAKVGDRVYVSKSNGDKVMVLDTQTDMVIDSITVTAGPVNMEVDADGNIWLACNGNFGQTDPKLHKIDPNTNSVIGEYPFAAPHSYTIKVALSGDGEQVYLLNNDIYTMFIGDSQLSADPIVDHSGSFYGFGVHPDSGDIYGCDAGDFSSPGTVFRYTSSGMEVAQYEVGISPNGLLFRD
jgi:YVTN family beta-propeller protein